METGLKATVQSMSIPVLIPPSSPPAWLPRLRTQAPEDSCPPSPAAAGSSGSLFSLPRRAAPA